MANSVTPVIRNQPALRRATGAIAVEFVLIMMASLAVFVPAGEFYRLSLFDQALARTTHQGARAAGANPANCALAIDQAINADGLASWLFDRNEDGVVRVVRNEKPNSWPNSSADQEVQIAVFADADLFDGVEWEVTGDCGTPGSWILIRSRIIVEPWFGPTRLIWPNGIRRQQESWARNQA